MLVLMGSRHNRFRPAQTHFAREDSIAVRHDSQKNIRLLYCVVIWTTHSALDRKIERVNVLQPPAAVCMDCCSMKFCPFGSTVLTSHDNRRFPSCVETHIIDTMRTKHPCMHCMHASETLSHLVRDDANLHVGLGIQHALFGQGLIPDFVQCIARVRYQLAQEDLQTSRRHIVPCATQQDTGKGSVSS